MLVTEQIHSLASGDRIRKVRVDAAPRLAVMENAQKTHTVQINAKLDIVTIRAHASEMHIHMIESVMIVVQDVHSQRLILVIATSAIQHLVWAAMMVGHRILQVSATRHAPPASVVCQAVSRHASTSHHQDLRMAQRQLFTSVQS
jgi:hypothetical protein